jgi:flagella basal body P-ring formation protein FlgA
LDRNTHFPLRFPRAAAWKSAAAAAVWAVLAASAQAQLERLLAPVEAIPAAEKGEASSRGEPAAEPGKKARDPQLFTAVDLLRELKAQLADHYTVTGDLALEMARPWGAISLPAADAAVTILDYPRDGLTSVMNVRCRVTSGNQVLGEWQITLRAWLWQEVWVAAARLDRGQELDESMVNAGKADALQKRVALLTTDLKPSAYELAQSVNAEAPLSKRDVVEKPVIRKNQIVDVTAKRGALSISMKAQALENGAAKALIRMRNLDSKREFNAQVIDETRAIVLF